MRDPRGEAVRNGRSKGRVAHANEHYFRNGSNGEKVQQGFPFGESLRAFLYDTLTQYDASLGDALHSSLGPKPFTVSSLRKAETGRENKLPNPLWRARFTALTAEIGQAMRQAFAERLLIDKPVVLDGRQWKFQRIVFDGDSEPFAQTSDYFTLWNHPPKSRFLFHLYSPTSFRMGDGYLPFPLPVSVYRSLREKWQRFAPSELAIADEFLLKVEQQVFPSRHRLHTERMNLSPAYSGVGCVGFCEFQVKGSERDQKFRQAFSALSRFAFYAGVGAKTTSGMGQMWVEGKS